MADPKSETFARSVDAIDAANLTWLRQLISEKGYPTAAQAIAHSTDGPKAVLRKWQQRGKGDHDVLYLCPQTHSAIWPEPVRVSLR